MTPKLKLALLLVSAGLFFNSCKKAKLEPDLEGTWIHINNPIDQIPTGCELLIDKSSGEVVLCGAAFVHPYNVVAMGLPEKAKLVAEDGQMYFKQKRVDALWIPMPGHEKLYFLDYEFDGDLLWIVQENTEALTSAYNTGMVFRKK